MLLVTMVVHVVALVVTGGPLTGPVSLRKPATVAETGWLTAWSVALLTAAAVAAVGTALAVLVWHALRQLPLDQLPPPALVVLAACGGVLLVVYAASAAAVLPGPIGRVPAVRT